LRPFASRRLRLRRDWFKQDQRAIPRRRPWLQA
jgi:hypothetical protein